MEIESAWVAFELCRGASDTVCTSDPNAEYLCSCGGCKEFNLDGLPVCTECGRCDDSYISDEPEWRGGMDDDGKVSDPSRVGAPSNLDHFSAAWNTGTLMRAGAAHARLAKTNFFTQGNHKDRALFHAYADMDAVGKTILGLPDNVMYAAKIKYRQFNTNVLTRGAVRIGVKANCIFQACKEFGVPRTTKEIADAFGIRSRDLSRTSAMYKEQNPDEEAAAVTTGPAALVARFFNSIEVEDKGRVKMKVVNACKRLDDSVKLQGRTPKAVACAVIFVILAGRITKADICRICEVSLPTLAKLEPIVVKELQSV